MLSALSAAQSKAERNSISEFDKKNSLSRHTSRETLSGVTTGAAFHGRREPYATMHILRLSVPLPYGGSRLYRRVEWTCISLGVKQEGRYECGTL